MQKGERPYGRGPGVKNKIGASLKEHFLMVFQELQEDEDYSLKAWAQDNLTDFYKLIAKLLPTEFTGDFYTVIEVSLTDDEEEENTEDIDHKLLEDGDEENDFG